MRRGSSHSRSALCRTIGIQAGGNATSVWRFSEARMLHDLYYWDYPEYPVSSLLHAGKPWHVTEDDEGKGRLPSESQHCPTTRQTAAMSAYASSYYT